MLTMLGGLLLLSACGIPEDDAPSALPPASPTPVVQAPTPAPPSTVATTIYLASADGRVRPAVREVGDPVTIQGLLDELKQVPTEEETDQGLVSVIPEETTFFSETTINEPLAILDLNSGSLDTLEGDQQTLALAQLVWTLTETGEINRIIIRIEGILEVWPTETDAQEILSRDDYVSFGPDFVEDPTPEPVDEPPVEEADETPAPTTESTSTGGEAEDGGG
jgi:hypothetical protein